MCFALLFAAVLTLVGCAGNKNDESQVITDISQLAGCGIGVVTCSAFDTMTDEYIENTDKQYYESYADIAVTLSKGKISGFLVDEPVGRMLCNEQKGLRFLDEYISRESYVFAFPKTDEGGALRDRFNEFLSPITADGTLDELKAKWMSDDENAKAVTEIDLGEMITSFDEDGDADCKKWFDGNIIDSYFDDFYPWTRLGYTY